ncbi:MAG: methyl-accepting chemotaxis protein [Treponema sp.]|nr:methyl-accepting chemotaxis protein [Treponema sp.]
MENEFDPRTTKKRFSVATRFTLQGVILVVISSFFLCAVSLGIISRLITKNVNHQLSTTLDSIATKISTNFVPYKDKLNMFALAVESGASISALNALIHSYSSTLGEESPCYFATQVSRYEPEGFYIDSTNWVPEHDWVPTERNWYIEAAKANGNIICGLSYIDARTKSLCITLSRLVHDSDKNPFGVVAIDIYIKAFIQLLSQMDLGRGGFIMLIQEDGTILADSSASNNTFKNISETKIPDLRGLIASGKKTVTVKIDGKKYLAQFGDEPETKCKMAAFTPYAAIYDSFYQTRRLMIFISVIFVVIAIIISTLTTQKIIGPLKSLDSFITSFISSMTRGDADYSRRVQVLSKDEIGNLAANFNLFIKQLQDGIAQIREARENEIRMGDQLAAEVQNLVVSTKETVATSQDSSSAVKEIVSTMEDSNLLSENISKKIKDVSAIASENLASVAEGVALTNTNMTHLQEILDANEKTISGVNTLREKIASIWDIVSLITNVADQAKIIAFNAELEASTAGEAGKSFRIVANEIRRLSDGIIDGTHEIKAKINEMQHSSDELILATQSGTEKINEGYESARGLEEKFSRIKDSATKTSGSANDIAEIIQQQAIASEQILVALKEISAGVENFSLATDNISNAAQHVQKIADDLGNAAKQA